MSTALSIDFHGQSLVAAMVNDVPHVAMKPICENIGLQWEAQRQRIMRHPVLKQVACMIKATSLGDDGKEYLVEMLMLPLNFLNGWLFGVEISRAKEHVREKLIEYQRECFDVLANHFMPKQAQPQALPEPPCITKAQAGILYNIVSEIAGPDGKVKTAVWSRYLKKFNLSSYHNTPADKFEDAKAYLELKLQEYNAGVRWHWLDDNEIQALVDERAKAMQGEVLPKEDQYTIPFSLYPRWFTSFNSEDQTITCKPVSPDCIVIEPDKIASVIADPTGSIYKKHLPEIISAVAKRMSDQ